MPQAYRTRLYADGLCRSCELPLLDEEVAADATSCGVCRASVSVARSRAVSSRTLPYKVQTAHGGQWAPWGRALARARLERSQEARPWTWRSPPLRKKQFRPQTRVFGEWFERLSDTHLSGEQPLRVY